MFQSCWACAQMRPRQGVRFFEAVAQLRAQVVRREIDIKMVYQWNNEDFDMF